MSSLLRGILLFIGGAIVGAAAVFLIAPGFTIVVARAPSEQKTMVASAPVPVSAPVAAVVPKPAPVVVAEVKPAAEPAKAEPAKVEPVAKADTTKPAMEVANGLPALDFKAISEHFIFWPKSVTVITPTTVQLAEDGKKTGEFALAAGAVLQLSKVLPEGQLEVRARGAKFEINSAATDFDGSLRKRVAELQEKGSSFAAPYLAGATPAATAPVVATASAPTAAAAVSAATPAGPKGPLTLEDKVNTLFGRKSEPKVEVKTEPAAPTATPAAAMAPATAVAPAATGDMKAEKSQDLDRKVNQLFKKDAAK
ncbi:MAG: hypothetical protein WCJ96_04690 [Verrucomicrobiota bacterium]|jgi:hypothetical protein